MPPIRAARGRQVTILSSQPLWAKDASRGKREPALLKHMHTPELFDVGLLREVPPQPATTCPPLWRVHVWTGGGCPLPSAPLLCTRVKATVPSPLHGSQGIVRFPRWRRPYGPHAIDRSRFCPLNPYGQKAPHGARGSPHYLSTCTHQSCSMWDY